MEIDIGKKRYRIVQETICGEKNKVLLCQEPGTAGTVYKTVWVLDDREFARKIIQIFSAGQADAKQRNEKSFMYEDCAYDSCSIYFVFPYETQRGLFEFYLSVICGKAEKRRDIWSSLLMRCMTCGIPYPVLYLILKQEQMELTADGEIHFQYILDLENLDEKTTCQQCVEECARICQRLMMMERDTQKGAELIEYRLKRQGYREFVELYKDIQILSEIRQSKKRSLTEWLSDNKDQIYHWLIRVCIVCLVIVAVLIVFRIALGEWSVYRLFQAPLDQIGTELLLQ